MSDNHSDNKIDDLVRRSTQVEIPANVEARMQRRLAEFKQRVEQRPASRLSALVNSLAHPTPFRIPIVTAALLAIIVAVLVFIPRGSKAGRVYAAAASQLRSAHSLQYTFVIAPYAEIDFAYLAPSYRRVNCSWGTEIRSDGSGKQIVLMHLTRNFAIEDGKQADTTDAPDLLDRFQSLPKSADESLGEQVTGGRKLIGYRVHEEPVTGIPGLVSLDLWVDAATRKPDHVDINIQEPGKPLYQMHVKNIVVDAEFLDSSRFEMTPPAGYTKIGTPATGQQASPLATQANVMHPEIKQAAALTAVLVSMNGPFPPSARAIQMAQSRLKEAGLPSLGPAFGRFQSQSHWQAGYPVAPAAKVKAPFEALSIPETAIATVVVTGPWGQDFSTSWGRDSGSRWGTFMRWIGEHGYMPAGPPMEVWSGDEAQPQSQTTEMRVAVTKAK